MFTRTLQRNIRLPQTSSLGIRLMCTNQDFKMRFNKYSDTAEEELMDTGITQDQLLRKYTPNYMFDLPYDLEGTHLIPKLPGREKPELFLETKMIDEEFLAEKFHKMVVDFYTSMANQDFDKFPTLVENRLATKVKKAAEYNNNKGVNLSFEPSEKPQEERPMDEKSYIFDKMFEKGVYIDRSKNDNNFDYYLDNKLENEGVRYYFHKYFTGYENHYYLDRYADQAKEDTEMARYKFKYIMDERNRSIVFRIFGVIRNIGRFTMPKVSGVESKEIYGDKYSGNHLVIFENQLKEPPIISMTNPNFDEWIKKHKINHNNWRITDIDNYMRGNPFFNRVMDSEAFKDFVDKVKSRKDFYDDFRVSYPH